MVMITKSLLFTLILFKVILPSADVYSDIGTVHELLNFNSSELPSFFYDNKKAQMESFFSILGYSTIFFMSLGFIATIPHYLRVENTWKRRLLRLPLLLLLCWPQFKACEVIYLGYGDDAERFETELATLDRELSHIGKMKIKLICLM